MAEQYETSQATIDKYFVVRFQVLTAASMMFRAVFWVVLAVSHEKVVSFRPSSAEKFKLRIPSLIKPGFEKTDIVT
jgi:hypothetical protein